MMKNFTLYVFERYTINWHVSTGSGISTNSEVSVLVSHATLSLNTPRTGIIFKPDYDNINKHR